MKIRVLILAGGKGTRMSAEVPKPLVPICGKPILDYVLEAVEQSGVDDYPAVVVGYQPNVMREFVGDRAEIVMQAEQLGTGHAVMVAREQLKDADVVLVSYGDHALYSPSVYSNMISNHKDKGAIITMLTTMLPDYDDWHAVYTHFGRILRGNDGRVEAIKEYKMCSESERAELEVNNGMYCFDGKWLWNNIDNLSDDNPKHEFLLTDLIALAMSQGHYIETTSCLPEQGIGVNTKEEVAIAEGMLKCV